MLIINVNFFQIGYWVLILLTSLIIGAAYVSIINDITDIKHDHAAGKSNYMANLSLSTRLALAAFCVITGGIFMCAFYSDKISLCLYIMSWVAFSLYSIPPVRLKTKGIWGVFADACGAHLFPSCLIIASLYHFMAKPVNWLWFTTVAIWALMLGLRGILSHQFDDRQKDIAAGVNTYASKIEPNSFKIKAKLLIIIELAALALMLIIIKNAFITAFLLLYVSYALLRYRLYKTRVIIIILNEKKNYRVLMNEYYQVFFPISVLLYIAIHQPYGWILLLLHIIVFHKIMYLTFNEVFTINTFRRFIQYIK
nr:UbiA family prenyltransferase [Mucilaginibacter sp. L196]